MKIRASFAPAIPTPYAVLLFHLHFVSGTPDHLRISLLLVTMALIDRVPGDLNLYIGGYVMSTVVSN